MPTLTTKQKLFAESYAANGGNGTAAAREAGYGGGDKALGVAAVRALAHVSVKAYLTELQRDAVIHAEKRRKTAVATLSEALAYSTRVMRKSRVGAYLKPDGEVDIEAVRNAPAGVIRKIRVKSTTDAEGQSYAQHELDMESGLAAAKTLIAHYESLDRPAADSGLGVLAALATLGDERVRHVVRALLAQTVDATATRVEAKD